MTRRKVVVREGPLAFVDGGSGQGVAAVNFGASSGAGGHLENTSWKA